jgi:diguanylate cyclase (GGDEF)-like protein
VAPTSEGDVVGFKCSLLAVDDEQPILTMLAAVLADEFDVLTALSAAEARAVLAQRDIDIVLSDQYLRDGSPDPESGVQLLEWVRHQRPATVRLLMTAQASLEDAIDAINHGQVHRFLLKPLNPGHLKETLHDCAHLLLLERSHEELVNELRRLNQELEVRVQQRTAELEEANRQLQYKNSILEKMALTDSLTGLPNRRGMDRLVRTELQRRSRHPAPLALLFVDADHFKDINTKYLLPGGDQALVWLAQVLAQSVRTVDSVGRIGGEEFLILAPDTPGEGAATLAERLRKAVESGSTVYNNQRIQLTVSIGAAVAEDAIPATYEQLRDLAAGALGEAKQTGRNRCVVRPIPAPEESSTGS